MPAEEIISYTIKGAVRASGISRSALYQHIAAGRIVARKAGTSTLVDAESLRHFLAQLPPAAIAVRHRRPARASGVKP
jgi:hypothetical protein